MDITMLMEMLRRMLRIRHFEAAVTSPVERGEIVGAAHSHVVEEAVAVGACMALRDDDWMTGNHWEWACWRDLRQKANNTDIAAIRIPPTMAPAPEATIQRLSSSNPTVARQPTEDSKLQGTTNAIIPYISIAKITTPGEASAIPLQTGMPNHKNRVMPTQILESGVSPLPAGVYCLVCS